MNAFEEALSTLRPVFGEPSSLTHPAPNDPEDCGYSRAWWHLPRVGGLSVGPLVALDDEDGNVVVVAISAHHADEVGDGAGWTTCGTPTRTEPAIALGDLAATVTAWLGSHCGAVTP